MMLVTSCLLPEKNPSFQIADIADIDFVGQVAVLAIGKWDEPYEESKLNTQNPIYKDQWSRDAIACNKGTLYFKWRENFQFLSG